MFDFGDRMIPFERLHPADDWLRPAKKPLSYGGNRLKPGRNNTIQ
jgi:hypothetical protein